MDLFERGGRDFHIPAEAKEVFDVTGAGDTAIGIFALSLASGASFREAAYLANKAAGIVVGKIGTATVSPAELKRSSKDRVQGPADRVQGFKEVHQSPIR